MRAQKKHPTIGPSRVGAKQATMATSTADSQSSSSSLLEVGAQVRLRGIRTRAGINGQLGSIIGWHPDTGRFGVELESGERVRVRPSNLVAVAANGAADVDASQQAARPSTPAKREADQSSAARRASAIVDPTLFVKAGRFVQPAANGRAMAHDAVALDSTQEGGYVVHRTQLPAGHWSVWSLERDGPRITATLIAGEGRDVEEQCGSDEVDQTWDELKGLVVTRTVDAAQGEVEVGLAGVATEVDGGVLKVLFPLPARALEQSGSRPRVATDGKAPQQTPEEDEATPPLLVKAASADLLDREVDGGYATWAGFDGAGWPQLDSPACHHKAPRTDFRRPLFVRRSQSLDADGRQRRSRKQASARRRAATASGERRRCMRGTLPQWKASMERTRTQYDGGCRCVRGAREADGGGLGSRHGPGVWGSEATGRARRRETRRCRRLSAEGQGRETTDVVARK